MRTSGGAGDPGRSGMSLLEALVALLLGGMLLGLLLTLLIRQRAVVKDLGERAELLATVRTVRSLLRREARASGAEVWTVASDSIGLRAYRGGAVVCRDPRGSAEILVAPQGIRGADPDKDSVWVLSSDGRENVLSLLQVQPGGSGCGGDADRSLQRWTLSAPLAGRPVLLRYFERGSYHLSGGAFRYRRGTARQPLTPESLRTPESHFGGGRLLEAVLVPLRGNPSRAPRVRIPRGSDP